MENSIMDEIGEYNKISSLKDVEVEEVLNRVLQRGRANVKRRGRRRARDEDAVKGLLDIVINNEVFKKKT